MAQETLPFYAHISDDGQRREFVLDHLTEVAQMAALFATSFGASGWARTAGLAHDIGKYSYEFQNRILHDGPKVDHSAAGALLLDEVLCLRPLAYCVAGHHGGLPDAGSPVDDGVTFLGRLRKARSGAIPDYGAYKNELKFVAPEPPSLFTDLSLGGNRREQSYALQFLTRMVFSCLVDADFLCTERFMSDGAREALAYDSLQTLRDRLEAFLKGFRPPTTRLDVLRCEVSDGCLRSAQGARGLYSLTAPTGSGKTYALLRFALQHACLQGMSRVICAEPYTSIIEQNAQVYRDVLGDENVLEHHSGFDFDSSELTDGGLGERLRLAAENWDAPIIVTTNVQLFESLYSNKTSRCRKLHNIANSVIVLDEAQMIPTKYLIPCVKALAELVKHYGCTVLLSSATQPALEGFFEGEGLDCTEIVADAGSLFAELERVTYRSLGPVSDDDLAGLLSEHHQALCIVNSRKQARALFDAVRDRVRDPTTVFHLTTLMYPEHRVSTLATIRRRVAGGDPCIVVATSLVEAGVDLDFPVVYRSVAGIDSMVQAAGRCNREGKRPREESFVYLFSNADNYALPRETKQRAAVSGVALPGIDVKGGDVSKADSLTTIERFFIMLYEVKGNKNLDGRGIVERLSDCGEGLRFDFAQIAHDFQLIEDGSLPIVIPTEDIGEEIHLLELGIVTRTAIRKVSRHAVNLYMHDIEALRDEGAISELVEGLYILDDVSRYSEATGLDLGAKSGEAFFW
ncbi:MAG: CRISPR-associated helicase Cas3' [Coriobacteriia bacterium]|nr:CRISPR-associated helicase Cas3' [Coriobacteriia bacterium]